MLGGGGGCWACFRSGPISVGGGGGSKRSAPLFPGPQGEPAHGLHPRFVVAEIWADRGGRGGGGGAGGQKSTTPFFGSKIMNLLFFSILSRKSVSGSRLHGVCMGRSGTSTNAVYALFNHFCYVGGFGDLGDPVVPTLRGVSQDVVGLLGVSQGIGTQPAYVIFHPGQLKHGSFRKIL